ncbi:MAG: ABC transporter ATP-binding protein [Pseudomonadota bacterium]
MLELEGVTAGYGRASVLHGVSLAVRPGEVLALMGRNGAGKSTTLKAAMQIVRPRAGRVRFAGAEITGRATSAVARLGLGYVPEDRRVFARLSVTENLDVGRQPPRPGAPQWDEARLMRLFPNLAERARAPAGQLSGGEQQMLAIARTLMGNPTVLLLDEPSEGIAPVIVEAMADTVRRLKAAGVAVLLSEQNLRFARAVADRAVVLDRGRVVFEGTLAALDGDPALRDAHLAV